MHRWLLILALLAIPTASLAGGDDENGYCDGPRCPSVREYLGEVETCSVADCLRVVAAGHRCERGVVRAHAKLGLLLCEDAECRAETRERFRGSLSLLRLQKRIAGEACQEACSR